MSIRRSFLALAAIAALGVAACSSGSSTSPGTSPVVASPASSPSTPPAMPSASSAASIAPVASPSSAVASAAASSGAVTGASSAPGLAGFCADFQSQFAATWPNIDPTTATTLLTKMQGWASDPELADIQVDARTILGWLTTAAVSGSLSSPPPDVVTAMTDIKTFAQSHC